MACVNFMSLRGTERQGFLACSCPNNGGNLRQFTCYCRQVLQNVGLQGYRYHNILYFPLLLTLSRRTVILCTQSTGNRQVLQAFHGLAGLPSALAQITKKRGPWLGAIALLGRAHHLAAWLVHQLNTFSAVVPAYLPTSSCGETICRSRS